jgi:hypothetical protein
MAKPVLKIWLLLAVVLLAGLAWPGLCGMGTESRMRESARDLDRVLAPWLRVGFESYQRGWLGSRADLELAAVGREKRRTLAIPLRIFHGPLPVAGIARQEAPLRLVKAALSGAIDVGALLGELGMGSGKRPTASGEGGKARGKDGKGRSKNRLDPIELRGSFEIGGNSRLRMILPVAKPAERDASFNGGDIRLDYGEGFEHLRMDIDLNPLSLLGDGGRRALAMGALQGHVETDKGSGQVRAEIDLGSLALARPGMRVGLDKVRAGRSLQRGRHALFVGRGSATAETAAIRAPGPGWVWKLRGLTYGDDARVEEKLFIFQSRLRIKQWQTASQSYGPLDATVTLSRMDARALAAAASELNRLRRSYDPTDPASRKRFAQKARQALVELARSGPRLEITLKLKQDAERAFADLRMAIDPARVESAYSLKRINNVARWVATMHVPAPLFEQGLRQGVESLAGVAKHLDLASQENRQKLYQNTLKGLLDNNLLTLDEKGYHGRMEWTGEKLLVNGKPLDPWLVIRIVAFIKALQGPGAQGPVKMGP